MASVLSDLRICALFIFLWHYFPTSHVPLKSLLQGCASFIPHPPTVNKRVSPVVVPTTKKLVGFDVTYFLLTIPHPRFTCIHLLATYLAVLNGTTFNPSFTTNWFPHFSMKRFTIRACTPNAMDLPPFLVKLRMNTLPIAYHGAIHSCNILLSAKLCHIYDCVTLVEISDNILELFPFLLLRFDGIRPTFNLPPFSLYCL